VVRGAVIPDVAQLEALMTRTFSIGLDVGGAGRRSPWSRLRLSRTLPGAAEAQAMAAEALDAGRWDIRARWFGVVICAMPRLSVLGLGITIPWRVIAAQITAQQYRGR
jgi:hypothetical protein